MNLDDLKIVHRCAVVLLDEVGPIDEADVTDVLTFATVLTVWDTQRIAIEAIRELIKTMLTMSTDLRMVETLSKIEMILDLGTPAPTKARRPKNHPPKT